MGKRRMLNQDYFKLDAVYMRKSVQDQVKAYRVIGLKKKGNQDKIT